MEGLREEGRAVEEGREGKEERAGELEQARGLFCPNSKHLQSCFIVTKIHTKIGDIDIIHMMLPAPSVLLTVSTQTLDGEKARERGFKGYSTVTALSYFSPQGLLPLVVNPLAVLLSLQ